MCQSSTADVCLGPCQKLVMKISLATGQRLFSFFFLSFLCKKTLITSFAFTIKLVIIFSFTDYKTVINKHLPIQSQQYKH